ncbi:MAG: hypothetical protein ACR2GY_02615 [Phycisphaerales bacterium]
MLKPDDRLFFIHIPKTAGTTLIPLIDMHFHAREICPAQLWREIVKLPQESLPAYRLFRGHFGGEGLDTFLPKPPLTMTMLRQPLPLALSTYKFILREPGTRVHQLVRDNNMSFAEFIEHPETRSKVSNKQVRHLSFSLEHDPDSGPIFDARESLAAIDQWVKEHRAPIPAKLKYERAIEQLMKCACFGLVERFDESMALLSYTFGWPAAGAIQKLRVAPKRDEDELDSAVQDRLAQLNQHDLALYDHAEKIFNERVAAMHQDLDRYRAHNEEAVSVDVAELLDRRARMLRRESQGDTHADAIRVHFDMDQPLFGRGWHRREASSLDGTTFCWSGPDRESTLDIAAPVRDGAARDLLLTVKIINWLDDAIIDSLAIFAQGVPMSLDIISQERSVRIYQACIAHAVLDPDERFLQLRFVVADTTSPFERDGVNADTRKVGIALNWVDLTGADALERGQVPPAILDAQQPQHTTLQARQRNARRKQLKDSVTRIPVIGKGLRNLYGWMKPNP